MNTFCAANLSKFYLVNICLTHMSPWCYVMDHLCLCLCNNLTHKVYPMLVLHVLNRISSLAEPCGVDGYFSIIVDDIHKNKNFSPRQFTVLNFLLTVSDRQREKIHTMATYKKNFFFFNLAWRMAIQRTTFWSIQLSLSLPVKIKAQV